MSVQLEKQPRTGTGDLDSLAAAVDEFEDRAKREEQRRPDAEGPRSSRAEVGFEDWWILQNG